MTKTNRSYRKSTSAAVLTVGDGGLSDQKAKIQPSPLLAQAENPKPSSLLAQTVQPQASIRHGLEPSPSGEESVLTTGRHEQTIKNSALAGTANWVLTLLLHRNLIRFVLNEEKGRYEAHFPVSTWRLIGDTVLALVEDA